MKRISIVLIIIISLIIFSAQKSSKKNAKQKKHKKIKNNNMDIDNIANIIPSVLEWAKNNSIYINPKLALNKKLKRDNYYSFYADSKIPNNTLLLRVPYNMMITQKNLYDIHKTLKNNKFSNLWENILNLKSEYVKYYSTQQLLYMSIILENAIRKKKGPIYKKYREYLKLYEQRNMDIYPVFYDQDEKYYLSGSNFGLQLNRATEALNEEYILLSTRLNISIPNQDDFMKTRVISLVSSTDFNNSNIELPPRFNETCIVPFLDCFNKVISSERANAIFDFKGIKNETTNYTDYYLEIYSNDEIYIGSELNLKWRPFPNTEFLIYYGQVEEGNPFNSKYYVDIINRKLKEDLGFEKDKTFENVKTDTYELISEFYDPFVINAYRNLSLNIDKYKNREEGAYELMRDNLKYYYELYENPLSDGNINIYINGNEKKKDIREIIHKEKKLIEGRISYLNGVIKGIKMRDPDINKNGDDQEDKNDTNENKQNNEDINNENKDKEEL